MFLKGRAMKIGFAIQGPCQGCERREVGCHSSCEEYKEYREHVDNMNAIRLKKISDKYNKYHYAKQYKYRDK